MTHFELIDRIKSLDVPTIVNMSPDTLAMLTGNFNESLVKAVLIRGTTNYQQRKIITAIKKAYKNWKKDTDVLWGAMPSMETYPYFMEKMKFDIECNMVLTEDGLIPETQSKKAIYSWNPGLLALTRRYNQVENNNNIVEEKKGNKQLAEAQKTIKEQAQTINEQQAELKRLTTMNEVLTKQKARYEEENPEMDIDEKTALSIKECIIFFSSIMDCNLNKEDISQMNLARLISKFTQWPKDSIRPQIVDINTERENNSKNHTAFSDGVHQAAVNVCALIENAMTGLKKNPLPYSCKQAVENICKIYKSPGRKIEPHEIAEAKINLKKI